MTAPGDQAALPVLARRRGLSPGRLRLRRFLAHRAAVASAGVLALLILLAAAAPWIEALYGRDATAVNLLARAQGPSAAHWLGTDELGRDLFLRLLHGGRVSLTVGLVAALGAAAIGTTIGLAAGFAGGKVDAVLMRLTDAVIALPLLPFLIVVAALDPAKLGLPQVFVAGEQASLWRIAAIVALFGWPGVARLVRGTTLSVRRRDFVLAARAVGAGPLRIALTHVLPNAVSPILVATTLSVGNIILLESVLSFLGLGIQPPVPSWGNMLSGAQDTIWSAPHLAIWPGLAIFVTVIAFNFLGDGLQDALDPRAGLRAMPRG